MIKKRLFLFLLILFTSGLWFACTNSKSKNSFSRNLNTSPGGFKVSSYIRTWQIPIENQNDDSPFWDASMIKGEYLTELIIAFALIDESDGTSIYIPYGSPNLWNEVAAVKKKYPNLRVNISIGGWGAGGFSEMAKNSGMRATFVSNVCDWLKNYNLDGVDIDWEYPVGPPWGKQQFADRNSYINLLQDLRNAMDTLGGKTNKRYSLSTAVPASSWFIQANKVFEASKIVDNFKLMSYDYYGGWSATTGHHSNLYKNSKESGGWSTDQAVNLYLKAGIPSEKIMLGVAFYGLAFEGVKKSNNGLFQKFDSVAFGDGSVDWPEIKEFLESGFGYTRYWDDEAKAPYLYNGDIWISYTDEEQIKLLTQYAKDKNLGGVFSWEYGHDMEAELLKAMSEGAK